MGSEVPPAERGATRIAERVVAKLAAQAAREALREGGPGGEAWPLPPLRRGGGPHATAVVRRPPSGDGGGAARIRVAVELGYPSDIGAQCGAVRRQVAHRVRELAGMEATDVAVDVERLHPTRDAAETVGRVR